MRVQGRNENYAYSNETMKLSVTLTLTRFASQKLEEEIEYFASTFVYVTRRGWRASHRLPSLNVSNAFALRM